MQLCSIVGAKREAQNLREANRLEQPAYGLSNLTPYFSSTTQICNLDKSNYPHFTFGKPSETPNNQAIYRIVQQKENTPLESGVF